MSDPFDDFGMELDRESFEWLDANHPRIADTMARMVVAGKTPDDVRKFVIRRCGVNRTDMAKRCEAALRYLTEAAKR